MAKMCKSALFNPRANHLWCNRVHQAQSLRNCLRTLSLQNAAQVGQSVLSYWKIMLYSADPDKYAQSFPQQARLSRCAFLMLLSPEIHCNKRFYFNGFPV
jgi:hypothetical protein